MIGDGQRLGGRRPDVDVDPQALAARAQSVMEEGIGLDADPAPAGAVDRNARLLPPPGPISSTVPASGDSSARFSSATIAS